MYTLLETCLDKLDIFEFLTHVEDGLKDHYDIKVMDFFLFDQETRVVKTRTNSRLSTLMQLVFSFDQDMRAEKSLMQTLASQLSQL